MQNRLIAQKDFETVRDNGDVASLLKYIRAISSQVETNVSIYDAVDESKRRYYRMYQGEEDTNATFLNDYRSVIDTMEHYESSIFEDPGLIAYEIECANKKKTTLSEDEAKIIVKKQMQGLDLIKNSDRKRYGALLTGIRDKFNLGIDVYPKTLNNAYDILESYASTHRIKPKKRYTGRGNRNTNKINGLQYSQGEKKIVPGTDGRVKKDIKCFKCEDWGHFADHCPKQDDNNENQMHQEEDTAQDQNDNNQHDGELEETEGDFQLNYGEYDYADDSDNLSFQFFNRKKDFIFKKGYNDLSILIYSGSTFSVIRNAEMLLNIRKSKRILHAISNGGDQDHNKIGDLLGFFTVWCKPESKLNILIWSDVRKRFRITSDTAISNSIFVHLDNGKKMEFKEIQSGLYMWNPIGESNINNVKVSRYSFLNLVSSNKKSFTKDEVKRADLTK